MIKTSSALKQSLKNTKPNLLVIYFFVVMFISILEILLPLFEGRLIDKILENNTTYKIYLPVIICALFVQGMLYFVLYNTYSKVKTSIINTISSKTLNDIVIHNRTNIQKKDSQFYHEALSREPDLIASCADPSSFFFLFSIIIAVIAMIISLKITFAFLIVIPIAIILYLVLNKFFAKRFDALTEKVVDVMYEAEPKFISYFDTAKTISRFGNTKFYLNNLVQLENKRKKVSARYVVVKELRNGLSEIISSLAFVALICIMFFDVQRGSITYGNFVVLLSFFPLMLMPLAYHGNMKMAITDAQGSFDIINNIQAECNQALSNITQFSVSAINALQVNNVSFSFDNDSNKDEDNTEEKMEFQYKDINFSIKDCKGVGFLGASGEGKSTIVKLLLGELSPSSGQILINGSDVSKLPQAILDYLICVYEQEKTILPGDLYENICLGRKMLSETECKNFYEQTLLKFKSDFSAKKLPVELAETFGIDVKDKSKLIVEFIKTFFACNPDEAFFASIYCDTQVVKKELVESLINSLGINHLQGRDFGEDGSEVSGGERERIAMARFLSRENASLYIIDEPFTALDSKTEDECLKLLASKMQNKNRLIISHKFNVLRALSSECIVLKEGSIFESGTHQELEKANGLYAELLAKFNAQHE